MKVGDGKEKIERENEDPTKRRITILYQPHPFPLPPSISVSLFHSSTLLLSTYYVLFWLKSFNATNNATGANSIKIKANKWYKTKQQVVALEQIVDTIGLVY